MDTKSQNKKSFISRIFEEEDRKREQEKTFKTMKLTTRQKKLFKSHWESMFPSEYVKELLK